MLQLFFNVLCLFYVLPGINSLNDSFIHNQLKNHVIFFDNILKGEQDSRQFRGLQFENELQVLLVADSDASNSAASMIVMSGSAKDNPKMEGQAHFLEHLLFMGNAKYPSMSEFTEFISENAGDSNAYTDFDITQYFFYVHQNAFEPALDRFLNFFIQPLISQTAIKAEIVSVNNELSNSLENDDFKFSFMEKETCNQTHDYHKFSVGNDETLIRLPLMNGLDPQAELRNFFNENYSANLMRLVVVSNHSINKLTEMFLNGRLPVNKILNRNLMRNSYKEHFLGKHQLAQRLYLCPHEDVPQMIVTFPTNSWSLQINTSAATNFINYLLVNQDANSLFTSLKQSALVIEIQADEDDYAIGIASMQVTFLLTKEGLEKHEQVLEGLFSYLRMIENSKHLYPALLKEQAKIRRLQFNFPPSTNAQDTAIRFSTLLAYVPIDKVVENHASEEQLNLNIIDQILSDMKPLNMRYTLISKRFEHDKCTQLTRYSNVSYSIEPIPTDLLNNLLKVNAQEFKFPKMNNYIPDEVTLYPKQDEQQVPMLVNENSFWKSWSLAWDTKKRPVTFMGFLLRNIKSEVSVINDIKLDLFLHFLNIKIKNIIYKASAVGYGVRIVSDSNELEIQIIGFTPKLYTLATDILKDIFDFDWLLKIDQNLFELEKKFLIEQIELEISHELLLVANSKLEELTISNTWSTKDRIENLESTTSKQVYNHMQEFLQNIHLESFNMGNLDASSHAKMLKNFYVQLTQRSQNLNSRPYTKFNQSKCRVNLKQNNRYLYEMIVPEGSQCVVIHAYQIGSLTPANQALIRLIESLLSARFFDHLRTKEQLAYTTILKIDEDGNAAYVTFTVQSTQSSVLVDNRMQAFIYWIGNFSNWLTQDIFENTRESLISSLSSIGTSLEKRSQDFWQEIKNLKNDWNKNTKVINELRNMNMKKFTNEFIEFFLMKPAMISLHVIGRYHSIGNEKFMTLYQNISDENYFKNLKHYFTMNN